MTATDMIALPFLLLVTIGPFAVAIYYGNKGLGGL